MRELLLASVASLGVSTCLPGAARAQLGGYNPGAADNTGADQTNPGAGSITVRLNGRFRFFAGVATGEKQADAPVPATGQPGGGGTAKNSGYNFIEYARLYPGFDGIAANGLRYGASLELRQDNAVAPGGGANGPIYAANAARGGVYLEREWGYLGMDPLGTLRFGATDGPLSLYATGLFENFNDGGWNGDAVGLLPFSLQLTYPFADIENEYSTSKLIYLSPRFGGFDFGVSFEPGTGGVSKMGGNCPYATGNGFGSSVGLGCDQLAATPGDDYSRRRDTVEALLRYRGIFGGTGVAATAGYMRSSKVADNGTPQHAQQFDGLSLGDVGLAATYAGLTVGGHAQYGRFNNVDGGLALAPQGRPDAFAWLAGASYTIGPLIIGANYLDVTSEGDPGNLSTGVNPTGQRREQGVAAGGTYALAPGVALFLSYLWDQRKESGYNFVTNADTAATGGNLSNQVHGQVVSLGTSFTW